MELNRDKLSAPEQRARNDSTGSVGVVREKNFVCYESDIVRNFDMFVKIASCPGGRVYG